VAFIKVPDRYRDGLAEIARLSEGSFSEVYEALAKAPRETSSQTELADRVSEEVGSVGRDQVKNLIAALTSLYQVRGRAGVSSEKLATEIYDAIVREGSDLVRKEDAGEFRSRLEKFLGLDSLNVVASKAKELQTDVERAFCEARILTDLRPVFGSTVEAPIAMVIVHTLKLAYHDAATGNHEEIFVALDGGDIEKLKAVLERAEKKAKSLAARLQTAGIKTVEVS